MGKRRVLIPLDGSSFSSQILHVVRDYFRPEDVELVLIRISSPILLTAESQSYTELITEQTYMGLHGTYSPHQEQLWSESTRERDTYRAELKADLEHDAEHLRQQGYKVATEIHFGEPAQRIIDFVNDMNIDVVAMTTHGRTGLGRLVLGSVAERVLRGVHVPVLLWRSTKKQEEPLAVAESLLTRLQKNEPLQIAVATDGSTFTKRAIRLASDLTNKLHAQLTLLVTTSGDNDAIQSQEQMQDAADFVADLGAKVQTIPLVGYTDEVILNYLSSNPMDLLVLGAFQDRGAGSTHAIGVSAHRLVQRAPTSVLLMKGEKETVKHILVAAALDDEKVVKIATNLAKQLDAQLDLVHVLPKTTASYLTGHANQELSITDALAQNTNLSAVLREWINEMTVAGYSEEQIHILQGDTLPALLEFARSHEYDLMVIGSQSGPGHFVGSIANGIVQFADQSVLLVRTAI